LYPFTFKHMALIPYGWVILHCVLYHIFLISPSDVGLPGCFQSLSIVNSAEHPCCNFCCKYTQLSLATSFLPEFTLPNGSSCFHNTTSQQELTSSSFVSWRLSFTFFKLKLIEEWISLSKDMIMKIFGLGALRREEVKHSLQLTMLWLAIFHFTMLQKWHPFSRSYTWIMNFWSFPGLPKRHGSVSLGVLDSRSEVQLSISHTIMVWNT
jgi:hypothetical protein